ncbi:MAG: hypothetical protein ABL875_06990 [Candidatus Nitrotoga sp.]
MDTAQATDAAQKAVGAAQKATEGLTPLSPEYVVGLSILATVGLIFMWAVFWFATVKAKESIHEILLSPSFFRTVTVMGVIAATVVLSLAGRLEGNTTGAILSGIVGYVLGQLSTPAQRHAGEKEKSDAHPL